MPLRTLIAAALLLAQTTASNAECVDCPAFASDFEEKTFYLTLYEYYRCDRWAQIRHLSASEKDSCMQKYLSLKLHFDPDLTVRDFRSLPSRMRAKKNAALFLKFKSWETSNPGIVRRYKEMARLNV